MSKDYYGRSIDPYLCHWKYIKRKRVNGKWKYYYNPGKYEVNKKNYKKRKYELTREKEWQDIVKRKDPEYIYTNSNGETVEDFDKYLLNKKHPIIDALTDIDAGRKVSTRKQDKDTAYAGIKDYIDMGINRVKRTVNLIGNLTVGYLTITFKNQQGSYESKKEEIRDKINTTKEMIDEDVKIYKESKKITDDISNKISNELKDYNIDPKKAMIYGKIGSSIVKKLLK